MTGTIVNVYIKIVISYCKQKENRIYLLAIVTSLFLRTINFPLCLEAPTLWKTRNIALALCVLLIHPCLAVIEC